MPLFKLPLSGNPTQAINPWTNIFNSSGDHFGPMNVTLGQSSALQVEAEVLFEVAGYGKQLGRIADAVMVLIEFLPKDASIPARDRAALHDLKEMVMAIDNVKKRHGRAR